MSAGVGCHLASSRYWWCQRAITRRHPSFRFHHADLVSAAYDAGGREAGSSYRFPFEDRSFDFVFVGSVFTHLLPDVVEAYLREIPRVLSPRGTCVASCYLLNDDTRLGVDSNRSFMSFPVLHLSGLCRLHDVGVPEAAVALEERFVRDAVGAAGRCVSDARRGRWAFGVPHEQDVLTIAHEPGALMER